MMWFTDREIKISGSIVKAQDSSMLIRSSGEILTTIFILITEEQAENYGVTNRGATMNHKNDIAADIRSVLLTHPL